MALATYGYCTYKSLQTQEADAVARRELENEVIGAGLELAKKSRVMGDYTALVESLNKGVSNPGLEGVEIAAKAPDLGTD
mmetsp:Transcript_8344/g.15330  ORF Transcript_8344/g.15330 Transcript_8344/m.15330 type:complete len:80 (-) Transcript_8344:460-699(-)